MKVTLVQSNLVWEDKKANLSRFDKKLKTILPNSSDIIVLPEMFSTGFSMNPSFFCETMEGETMQWLKNQAQRLNASIVASLIISENDAFYNRLVWYFPNGTYQYYDKRHLFAYGKEDLYYTAGSKKLIVEWKGWKICPLVCYDVRFPVWSRNVEEYDLLIYIANFPERRCNAWKTLLIARAIENQCFTIGVNRIGKDGNGINHRGDSLLIDFMGNIIFNSGNKSIIKTFEIDKNIQEQTRNKMPFLADKDIFMLKF